MLYTVFVAVCLAGTPVRDCDQHSAARAAAENNRAGKDRGRSVVDCPERTGRQFARSNTDIGWSGAELYRLR